MMIGLQDGRAWLVGVSSGLLVAALTGGSHAQLLWMLFALSIVLGAVFVIVSNRYESRKADSELRRHLETELRNGDIQRERWLAEPFGRDGNMEDRWVEDWRRAIENPMVGSPRAELVDIFRAQPASVAREASVHARLADAIANLDRNRAGLVETIAALG